MIEDELILSPDELSLEDVRLTMSVGYECDTDKSVRCISVQFNLYDSEADEYIKNCGSITLKKFYMLDHDPDSFFMCMDGISQQLSDMSQQCSDELFQVINVLYIEEFIIDEKYRNIGFGSNVMFDVLHLFASADDLIIVKPFAIHDTENDTAHQKVKNFYVKNGFNPISEDFYATQLI